MDNKMNGSEAVRNSWVLKIIIITVICYVFQLLTSGITHFVPEFNANVSLPFYFFGLRPFTVIEKFYVWQLVSYMFLHSNMPLHILFNMYMLYIFGIPLEQTWGPRRFLFYYFFTGIGAGLTILALNTYLGDSSYYIPTIGASGAVFGVLLAFGMLYPNIELRLLLPPITLKAKYLVIIYAGINIYLLFSTGGQGGVSYIGHIGGLLFGLIYFFILRKHGIKFKSKLIKAKMKKERTVNEIQKSKTAESNKKILATILKKVKKSGPDALNDDEFQHIRYLQIMIKESSNLCVEEDFHDGDDYCKNCTDYEACMVREIMKYM